MVNDTPTGGDGTPKVSPQTLLIHATNASFNAAKAVSGHASVLVRGNVVTKIEPDPSYSYSPEVIAKADQVKRVFGNFYFREGALDYDGVKALLTPLADVPVLKSHANHMGEAFTAPITTYPFRSLLQSMDHQQEAWQEMINARRLGGRAGTPEEN